MSSPLLSVTTALVDATAGDKRRKRERERERERERGGEHTRSRGGGERREGKRVRERRRAKGRDGGREGEMVGGMAVVISESVPDSH